MNCIRFTGYIRPNGYGVMRRDGRTWYAHRWHYEQVHGPIPEGMWIDHLCRNRACINLDHLEVVTPKTNTSRGMSPAAVTARTGYCQHGHAMEGYNVVYIKTTGKRRCRECARRRDRERYARKVS